MSDAIPKRIEERVFAEPWGAADVVSELERLAEAVTECRKIEEANPRLAAFWEAVRKWRVIAGHPDTIAAARSAALGGELDGVTLWESQWAEPGTLLTGEAVLTTARSVTTAAATWAWEPTVRAIASDKP